MTTSTCYGKHMSDKTFMVTVDQLKLMFDAGVSSEKFSNVVHSTGCFYYGMNADFIESVHMVVNADKEWGQAGYTSFDDISALAKEPKA